MSKIGVEKQIEKSIINYLLSKGAWVEGLQSGSVMIKKGAYINRMNLCSNGTPDIICFINNHFIAIEVKKSEQEVNKWLKLETRYIEEGKLPKSYKREPDQIKHKHLILKNGGTHIVTCNVNEIIQFIESL